MTTKIVTYTNSQSSWGSKHKKQPHFASRILTPKEIRVFIRMEKVVFNARNMTLTRPSIFSDKSVSVANGYISLPYHDYLEGEYELVRLDEDTIKLERV